MRARRGLEVGNLWFVLLGVLIGLRLDNGKGPLPAQSPPSPIAGPREPVVPMPERVGPEAWARAISRRLAWFVVLTGAILTALLAPDVVDRLTPVVSGPPGVISVRVDMSVPDEAVDRGFETRRLDLVVSADLDGDWKPTGRVTADELPLRIVASSNFPAEVCRHPVSASSGPVAVNPRDCDDVITDFVPEEDFLQETGTFRSAYGEAALTLPEVESNFDREVEVGTTYEVTIGSWQVSDLVPTTPDLAGGIVTWREPQQNPSLRAVQEQTRNDNQRTIYLEGLALAVILNLFTAELLTLGRLRTIAEPPSIGLGSVTVMAIMLLPAIAISLLLPVAGPIVMLLTYLALRSLQNRLPVMAPPRLEAASSALAAVAPILILLLGAELLIEDPLITEPPLLVATLVPVTLVIQGWLSEILGRGAATLLLAVTISLFPTFVMALLGVDFLLLVQATHVAVGLLVGALAFGISGRPGFSFALATLSTMWAPALPPAYLLYVFR
jgi:hypothetical protein